MDAKLYEFNYGPSLMRVLIDAGCDLCQRYGIQQRSVIHISSICDDYESVKDLINAGVSPDIKDAYGRTPLYIASEESHTDIVRFLIDTHADVNAQCCFRSTLLINAGAIAMHHKEPYISHHNVLIPIQMLDGD